jgi:hypothetical protein
MDPKVARNARRLVLFGTDLFCSCQNLSSNATDATASQAIAAQSHTGGAARTAVNGAEYVQRLFMTREFPILLHSDLGAVSLCADLLAPAIPHMSDADIIHMMLELKGKLPSGSHPGPRVIMVLAQLAPALLRAKGQQQFPRTGGVQRALLSECLTAIHSYPTAAVYLTQVGADGQGMAAIELTCAMHVMAAHLEWSSQQRAPGGYDDELMAEGNALIGTLMATVHEGARMGACPIPPAYTTKAFLRMHSARLASSAASTGCSIEYQWVWEELLHTLDGDCLVHGG